MAKTIKNVIKKIKAILGFHGVSDSDVLKAGNTAYDGLLNCPASIIFPHQRQLEFPLVS